MLHVKVTVTIPDPPAFDSFEKQIPVGFIEIVRICLYVPKLLF